MTRGVSALVSKPTGATATAHGEPFSRRSPVLPGEHLVAASPLGRPDHDQIGLDLLAQHMEAVRRRVSGGRPSLEPVLVHLRRRFRNSPRGGVGELRAGAVAIVPSARWMDASRDDRPAGCASSRASASASRPPSVPSYPTKIVRYIAVSFVSGPADLRTGAPTRHPGEAAEACGTFPQGTHTSRLSADAKWNVGPTGTKRALTSS